MSIPASHAHHIARVSVYRGRDNEAGLESAIERWGPMADPHFALIVRDAFALAAVATLVWLLSEDES